MERDLRAQLTNELSRAYEAELPNIPEGDGRINIVQRATNSLICIGGIAMDKNEVIQAIDYFGKARIILDGDGRVESTVKARYCKLAYDALKEELSRQSN